MRAWKDRPKEEAYLLNPAFCCAILTATIEGHSSSGQKGLPFVLSFMILPIVLHKWTREALPRDTRTSMAFWIQENTFSKVGFHERLMSLKPYTREAIRFGMARDWIILEEGGQVSTSLKKGRIDSMVRTLSGEARECLMRGRFVGKWFAAAGNAETVMAFWGISP